MEQRRLRVGDHIDDYCPRERRLTNHAIVAMVEDTVKQTRCTTCDAEHVYKEARVPPRRKPKAAPEGSPTAEVRGQASLAPAAAQPSPEAVAPAPPAEPAPEAVPAEPPATRASDDDEGPVHRRLIRAVLPRGEGQVPVRQMPEFTMRQPGVRHPDLVNGNGRRGRGDDFRASAPSSKGGHGRASRHGKGGWFGGSSHGPHHAHGQRRGRHSGGGKKRSR